MFTKASSHPVPPDDIDHPNMLSEFKISDAEVLNGLLNLDTTKAMGPDGIPPIVLQRCATAVIINLSAIYFI